MKTAFLALALGLLTEAALCIAMEIGGVGPHGPASPLSGAILLIHRPGIWMAETAHIPEPAKLILILALYASVWSVGWGVIVAKLSKKET